ncbi:MULTISPECIES: hypothetical protein [unclassified Ochrobactrum]|uniref:hypothetical protein n=1 Tax=Brucella/Ochrobactrum group TaxID=2826938 RepID=UPI000991D103|nr:hypothetical protein [Ochrobactrum sp. P6BSIII]OOL16029.1 hypothetical protein BRY73_16290 [Ochrobactrum sp. P6BS-III]
MKLTRAQKKLLISLQSRAEFLSRGEEVPEQLVKMRLAKWVDTYMGRGLLSITRAGRAALSKKDEVQ